MIKFPNLENYVSNYNSEHSYVKIRIAYVPKNENMRKYAKFVYLAVHTPFASDILLDIINNLLFKKNIHNSIKVEILEKSNPTCIDVNMWQLVWFINNITEHKLISVTINTLNPNYDGDETVTVDLTDEKSVKRFLSKLVEYSS